MAPKIPEMDATFAAWYADAFMESGPIRDARWRAVVEVGSTADHLTIEILVRLAYAIKVPPLGYKDDSLKDAHAKVIDHFTKDSTLDASRSARETQILAAATLTRLFESNPDAALAVSTASFGQLRKTDLPMDIVGFAKRALRNLSFQNHTRLDLKSLGLAAPKLEFTVAEQGAPNPSQPYFKQEIERLSHDVNTTFTGFANGISGVLEKLTRRIALADEELQMLWWLNAGNSTELGQPFADIEISMRPLVLGKELGRMTTISPGPASIYAMLSRARVELNPVYLQDAVNAVSLEWAKEFSLQGKISPITTPVHFAIEKRVEMDSADAWQASWAALTSLPADMMVPAISLGEQFYREHLFLLVND